VENVNISMQQQSVPAWQSRSGMAFLAVEVVFPIGFLVSAAIRLSLRPLELLKRFGWNANHELHAVACSLREETGLLEGSWNRELQAEYSVFPGHLL